MSGTGNPITPQVAALLSSILAQKAANAPAIPDVFANQMRMGVTLTDFTIIFGTIEGTQSGQAFIADKATVHMAPGVLKQLSLHLARAVNAYEKAIAEIPVPKRLAEGLENLEEDLIKQLRQQMERPMVGTFLQQANTQRPTK